MATCWTMRQRHPRAPPRHPHETNGTPSVMCASSWTAARASTRNGRSFGAHRVRTTFLPHSLARFGSECGAHVQCLCLQTHSRPHGREAVSVHVSRLRQVIRREVGNDTVGKRVASRHGGCYVGAACVYVCVRVFVCSPHSPNTLAATCRRTRVTSHSSARTRAARRASRAKTTWVRACERASAAALALVGGRDCCQLADVRVARPQSSTSRFTQKATHTRASTRRVPRRSAAPRA